jgi:hypothetical protein
MEHSSAGFGGRKVLSFFNLVLPWSHNLNFQIMGNTLEKLGNDFNSTLFRGRYLIDVNPHFRCLIQPAGKILHNNKIDARFIGM